MYATHPMYPCYIEQRKYTQYCNCMMRLKCTHVAIHDYDDELYGQLTDIPEAATTQVIHRQISNNDLSLL